MKCKARFSILICMIIVSSVLGHGRMIDPPSHNSAWRFKPQNTQTTSLTVDGLACRGKQTAAYMSIPTMRKISLYLPTEIRQRYHHQDLPRGPRIRSAHRDNVQLHGDNFFFALRSENWVPHPSQKRNWFISSKNLTARTAGNYRKIQKC